MKSVIEMLKDTHAEACKVSRTYTDSAQAGDAVPTPESVGFISQMIVDWLGDQFVGTVKIPAAGSFTSDHVETIATELADRINTIEKRRRIYYQGIVYEVCRHLDRLRGRVPGKGIVCGTLETPATDVQDEMKLLSGLILDQKTKLEEHVGLLRGLVAYLNLFMKLNAINKFPQPEAVVEATMLRDRAVSVLRERGS